MDRSRFIQVGVELNLGWQLIGEPHHVICSRASAAPIRQALMDIPPRLFFEDDANGGDALWWLG